MGYYTRYDGEISIDPPLTWAEIRNSAWAPGGNSRWNVKLAITEEAIDTDEGPLTRRTSAGLVPLVEDGYKGDIVAHVQAAIDAFPGHAFSGRFDCEGEDSGDIWRLVVRNGRAEKVKPRIVWPDEDEAAV